MKSSTIDRSLRAEASAWIAKLHGPERSRELEEDFRAWLRAKPEHALAFEHMTEIWDSLANVSVGGLPRLAAGDEFARRSQPRRHLLIGFAATLLLLAAGFAIWLQITRGEYSTDIGEQRIVSLDDGSRVHLNSGSRLRTDIGQHVRRIELERGEAYFEVAQDPARPFIVNAGDRTVTALGTAFVVRYEPDRTAVTLVEGKVRVESSKAGPLVDRHAAGSAPNAERAPVALSPGQRITFEPGRAVVIDVPRAESTAAWRRGEIVLEETSLASVVAEMNRYQRQRLTLDDASLGDLPISGIYRLGNNQDFAHAIAAVYDLEVIVRDGEIHLRRP